MSKYRCVVSRSIDYCYLDYELNRRHELLSEVPEMDVGQSGLLF